MKSKEQLEQQEAERQIEESAARLNALRAKAERRKAEAALADVSGVQAFADRVRNQFRAWRNADEDSWNNLKADVHRGTDALSKRTDAVADRLDRVDAANDKLLDAEFDQLESAIELLELRLEEGRIEDQKVGAAIVDDLRVGWKSLGEKQRAFREAIPERKEQARADFQQSMSKFKGDVLGLWKRVKSPATTAESSPSGA